MKMTSHTSDMPICERSFHDDSTSLNQIDCQCIQDSDERSSYSLQKSTIRCISDKPNIKSSDVYDVAVYDDPYYQERIKIKLVFDDYESYSEDEIHRSDEFNSGDEQERNMQRSISDKPNIELSDVYDVNMYGALYYEGRLRIDDDKSCLEPEVCRSGELNTADEQENNLHLKESAVKYKKYTTNKNDLSDKLEICSNASSDDHNSSVSSDDYEVPAKKKKNEKSKKTSKKNLKDSKAKVPASKKKNEKSKQSADKFKKCTVSKNNSSDEFGMSSSDSSDEQEMPSPDSSVDWEMPSPDSSVDWEMPSSESSHELEMYSTTSNDDYSLSESDPSEVSTKEKKNQKPKIEKLSKYEEIIQKNRDEKLAFLQSLRMDEVKEDLNEAIRNLKPKEPPKKRKEKDSKTPQDPSRKSLRLAEVHLDLSEKALIRKAFPFLGKGTKKNNRHLKQSTVDYKKSTANKSDLSDELETSSNTSSDDHDSDEYEVKEDLNEAKRNLKPKRRTIKRNIKSSKTPQDPSRKSLRLAEVHLDLSEKALEAKAFPFLEKETKMNNRYLKQSTVDYKKSTANKSDLSDELETCSNTSSDDHDSDEYEFEELTEYEKMIQKNKDEKLSFLQSLKMNEVKEDLNKAIRNLKPKRPPKGDIKSSKSVSTPQIPTRKSRRLQKVDLDEERRKKVSRKALHTRASSMLGIKIEKELSPILTFKETFIENNTYADFVRDFDDLDFTTPKPFADYVSCFTNMKLKTKIRKVIPGSIRAMALHPMKEKVIGSAGNEYGAISFWHETSDSVPYVFVPHTSKVSCLKFNADLPNQIISCSYDGTMRIGDMEKRVFTEVFNISEKTSCSYFDFISPTTIVVCDNSGHVSLVDIRSESKSAEKSHKCHKSSVRSISVHPVNNNYFVSADIKGFLCLWDLRKLETKPVIEVNHHKASITTALFSPVTGNSILSTSGLKDSICLYDCSKLGSAISLYRNVWRREKYATPFNATWLPNTDDAFVIGSMEYPNRIEIFDNKLDNIYSFQDEDLSITFFNVFHPSLPLLAGGNRKDSVYIFS
ncbi:unnamed protein product [Larinioides sclopetarius]|uniref:WD repeat-containing protein 76 n=1 Tax=Larinioides sclopetarius TaxID=280406 RepID=A0AAV2BB67_9ARAC